MADETKAKYHHLVPKTYLSAWSRGYGTLKVEYKNDPGVIVERNKDNIAGITNFHSIKAGMPICTQADTDLIFAAVSPFTVTYEGKVIHDTLELNKLFYDFDKWEITRADGTPVRKKQIRHEIEQVKIKDIEANWSIKYENDWSAQVTVIEDKILNATNDSIPAFDREYIMKFFTALDWRGFTSNAQFESALSLLCHDIMKLGDIDIPEEDRLLPSLTTAEEEMRHNLLLQYYRQYLNDTGVIYHAAMANLKYTSFHFLVADGPTMFITSDTPAFVYKRPDDTLAGLLPITPRILMVQGKNTDNDGSYYITHITDEAVQRYNKIIRENAEEFVILTW